MAPSLRSLFALAAATLVAACGGGGSSPPPPPPAGVPLIAVNCAAGPASLEGVFKAPNGTTPVGGATVTLSTVGGCSAITNAEGKFKFTGLQAITTQVTAEKGNFLVSSTTTPGGPPVSLVIPANSVKLAYVAGSYDSIENVLAGLGFSPVPMLEAELATTNLAQYDAVFLNCGLNELYLDPTYDPLGEGELGPDAVFATTTALRSYVHGGGTLYASDYASDYVAAAFPGRVTFLGKMGESTDAGPVTAQVLDTMLQTALNSSTARIMFDLGAWEVIDTVAAGTTILIQGPATYFYGDETSGGVSTSTRPFAVRFTQGTGRVTYTSFHNEPQVTADMQKLLESMVFGL